jgi:transcriptional regulator with XRE-family HTH domain
MACSGDVRRQFVATFGAWRKRSRTPLKAVAAELRVSKQAVHQWETGARFPSGEHLQAIVRYTGIPACVFFGPANNRPPMACHVPGVNYMLKTGGGQASG